MLSYCAISFTLQRKTKMWYNQCFLSHIIEKFIMLNNINTASYNTL